MKSHKTVDMALQRILDKVMLNSEGRWPCPHCSRANAEAPKVEVGSVLDDGSTVITGCWYCNLEPVLLEAKEVMDTREEIMGILDIHVMTSSSGQDSIYFETNVPDPIDPDDKAELSLRAPRKGGVDYVQRIFGFTPRYMDFSKAVKSDFRIDVSAKSKEE